MWASLAAMGLLVLLLMGCSFNGISGEKSSLNVSTTQSSPKSLVFSTMMSVSTKATIYTTKKKNKQSNSTIVVPTAKPAPTTKPVYKHSSTQAMSIKEKEDNEKVSPTINPTKMLAVKVLRFLNNATGMNSNVEKTVHETVEFDCQAEGTPKPTVQWLKNKNPIELVSYRLLQREKRSEWKLELTNLLQPDSGSYRCIVTNGVSTITRSFALNVKDKKESMKPTIELLKPGNISLEECTKVEMECWARAELNYTIPYIQWEKKRTFLLEKNDTNSKVNADTKKKTYNEKELRRKFANLKYIVSENNNTLEVAEVIKIEKTLMSKLVFNKVSQYDDAEYSCVVFNEIGYSKASQSMHVYPAPKPSRLQLALMYAAKYGKDNSTLEIPLAVIVCLPVTLIVIFVIGIIWWKENKERPREQAPVTLLDIKKMREIDAFSSLEHMANSSSHADNKRFSSMSDVNGDNEESDEHDSDEHQENERLLGNGNHFIQIINPKQKTKDDSKAEIIPMQVINTPTTETPKTARSSTMGSHEELEWEPVDLELNVSASSKSHTSRGSDAPSRECDSP